MDLEGFRALVVREDPQGRFSMAVERRRVGDLPGGDVLIRVAYSCLNYKDALSCSGMRRVTQSYPHTPGIDAAGSVVESRDPRFRPGDEVLVTGFDLGMNTPGGLGEYIRVPAGWVMRRPVGLSARDSMLYGTAGLTAALSVLSLQASGVAPGSGPVLVTGASGGTGCLAVAILARAGYEVVASTGKGDLAPLVRRLGAAAVVTREELLVDDGSALSNETWRAAVDTVGGAVLANVLRAVRYGGCVTCCGWTGGAEAKITMHPFILRGVRLVGIESALCPMNVRAVAWDNLAGAWRPASLAGFTHEHGLEEVSELVARMLEKKSSGRHIIKVAPS